eukprot:jgi/Phyca11/114219/e_gw1.25.221.1
MALKLSSSDNNLSNSIASTTATDNREIVEAEEGVPLAIAPSMDPSKTAMVRQFDRGDVIPFFFAMPHNGEAAVDLANCLERMLQRERTGIFEPPPGKTALLLLDDLHLSTPDSSKPLYPSVYTFLRSVQEHRKVYQGSNCLPISFFPVLSSSCQLEELYSIFEQALTSHWGVAKSTGTLTTAVKNALPMVIAATTVLWNHLRKTYQYNLHDLAKVYGALAVVKPTLLSDMETLLRLWTHESSRTLREPSMGLTSSHQDAEIIAEITRMRALVAQMTQRRASARAMNQPSSDETVSPAALLALFEARSSVSSSKTQRSSVQFNSIQDQAELMGDSVTKPWIYAEIIFEDESEAMATSTMQMYFRDLWTFSSTSMQLRPQSPKESMVLPRDSSLVPFKLVRNIMFCF